MALGRFVVPALVGTLLWGAQGGAQATTGSITGRVVDSTGQQAIPGVAIVVVGTQRGTLTRDDGTFVLGGVPAGTHTLRATRIGYGPQSRTVSVSAGGSASVEFALGRQAAVLQEVVTVGYGTQRREAITGAIATVNAEQANVGVLANANQMLQGRVAGVQMTTNNGDPGGGAQIRVRGGTSISASNEPLYVIDGVPLQNENTTAGAYETGDVRPMLARSPINALNPNDIESITVLKDASATAIYGSRGANGVILIQTKRGAGGRAAVEYEAYVAAASVARRLDFLTGSEYRNFVTEQVRLGNLPASQLGNLGTANTDWEDELTRPGYATNHNLSFAGGSQTTQYRASLNYFDQQGIVISSGLKRYQGRLNANHAALEGRLNLGLNLMASRVDNDFIPMENGGGFRGGVFTNMALFNPSRPVRNPDGTFYQLGAGAQDVRNPVAMAELISDQSPESRVLGNLTGSFSIFPNLIAQTTLGVDYTSTIRQTYFPRSEPIGAEFSGLARQAERSLQNLNFQQLLTFSPGLGDRHELEVVGGYEFTDFDNSGFEVVRQGFVTDVFRWDNLSAGSQESTPPVSYHPKSRLVSFFSRANYGFADRYFLTGVIRRDGSSRLAEGNKWATFPALSASWRVSNEDFMSGRPLGLSTLAVRAGWGLQGNQAVRPYATQLLLRTSNSARYPIGGEVVTGIVAAQVENPNLKWETSEQVNVGVDYGFSNDRFTGLVDFYQKTTRDLLLTVPVAQPAVVDTTIANVGRVQNRGLEASLDARLLEQPSRTLAAGLVLSVERNEVQSLGEGRQFIPTGDVFGQGQSGRRGQRIIPGEPLGTFWGPKFLRVDAAGRQVFRCVATSPGCVNGETFSPTGADEMIIGDANPDFNLGFRSNGSWGKFDASWLWRAEFGRDVFNNTALVYGTKGNAKSSRNFLASALDDPTGINEPSIYSSRWIENGRFVRLQNATVGYTFTLPNRLGTHTTRLYLSGDNLLLFTPYSGYDPEVFVSAGIASRGIDYVTYPRARTFTLGGRVQF